MRARVLRRRGDNFIKARGQNTKSTSWGKYFYITALLTFFGVALSWGYENYFFVRGIGFLEAETTYIEARMPGRIMQINCDINDNVVKGQALVTLGDTRSVKLVNRRGNLVEEPSLAHERQIINAESKIRQVKQEIDYTVHELDALRNEYDRATELLAINVVTRPELLHLQEKVNDAKYELSILNIQVDTAVKLLRSYEERYGIKEGNGSTTEVISGVNSDRVLYAAEEGVVSSIYKQRGEVARIGEPVLKVVNQNKVFIKAYFSGEHEKSIVKGDEVSVQFANGETSIGLIRDIHPTAIAQPSEIKRRFGPAERHLIAEITPAEGEVWQRVLETKVKIFVPKKWF